MVIFLLLVSCMDKRLLTEDNMRIAYSMEGNGPAVLLVHMLNENKSSWDGFAKKLHEAGFSTVAIDLRGHGESEGSWTTFSEEDYKKMELDIKAAYDFVTKKNIPVVSIVGASIGANHALRFAKDTPLHSVVLLSPGLDYRGITTQDVIKEIKQPLLIISSEEDTYAAKSSASLHATHGELQLLVGNKHGTRMLNDTVSENIISWLKENEN